jgi:hypothetical protein
MTLLETVYAVRTLPVRDTSGAIRGWVRADVLADGSSPSNLIILRGGVAMSQADALEACNRDPSLLFRTRDEAVTDGIDRLRDADQRGNTRRL